MRACFVLALTGALVALFATPAHAVSVHLSGEVVCVEAQQVVTWSLYNDAGSRQPSFEITILEIDRGTVDGFGVGTVIPAFDTVAGTTTLPADVTGTVTLFVRGRFSDGSNTSEDEATVELPGVCVGGIGVVAPPGVPSAAQPAAAVAGTPSFTG